MATRKRKAQTVKKKIAPREPKEPIETRRRQLNERELVQTRPQWKVSEDLTELGRLVPITGVEKPGGRGLECLAKNPILRHAEAIFNSLPLQIREAMLRELLSIRELPEDRRVDAYMAMCERYQLLRGRSAQRHVRKDWLDRYFGPRAVDILVAAGIVAVQRALQTGLPIDMYWSAGPDKEMMRFAVAESPYQITVILSPPKMVDPKAQVVRLDRPERIWFTKQQGDGTVSVLQNYATALERE